MKIQAIPVLVSLLLANGASAKGIPSNAAANLVLGQPGFTTGDEILPSSSFSLDRPEGVAVDPVTRKVFVTDRNNSRVLRYRSASSLANGAGAEAVFGQAKFSTTNSGSGELNMSFPIGIFFDRLGRLWVADTSNNRVLMFEAASYRGDQPSPDRVFGQPDFATVTSGTTAAKMGAPYGVWVDSADNLWVVDQDNNRVLRFNSVTSKSSGASADGVLGQPNFTSFSSATTASGLSTPRALAVSKTGAVFVADDSNHRVLRFDNAAALGNGAGASAVLGQAIFTTNTTGLTASTFNNPRGLGLGSDDTLWVGDYDNRRVLGFKKASTLASGAAAHIVLGQPDFVTNTETITSRGSMEIFGILCVDSAGSLWVPDTEHSRVLRFPADSTKPSLAITSTVPNTTSEAKLTIKGTASDANGISKVQYKVNNGSVKNATGTTSWQFKANLSPGKNKITIYAIDNADNKTTKVVKVTRQ